MNIFKAELEDDVSAKSANMASSIEDLAKKVRFFGDQFKASQKRIVPLISSLKDAKKLFKETGGNISIMKSALKASGLAAVDQRLIMSKLTRELTEQRAAALGMRGIWERVFNPRAIWVFSHALNVASKGWNFGKGVFGIAEKVGGFVVDKSKELLDTVVKSAELRQDTIIALKDVMKGTEDEKEKQAQEIYHYMAKAATFTPLDTDYLLERTKELMEQGYSTEDTKKLMALVMDQQTEFKGQTGEILTETFARIKSQGIVMNRDFRSLIAAKIPLEGVFRRMAEQMGINEQEQGKLMLAVKKKISKGEVNPNVLLNAIIAEQESRHDKIGAFAVKNSQTLTGAINNFQNAIGDLLKIGDVTKWKGIESLAQFFQRAARLVTDEKGVGGRLLGAFERFTNGVLGGLEKITDQDIIRFFDWLITKIDWVTAKAKELWGYIDEIVHAGSITDAFNSVLSGLKNQLIDLGRLIGQGIAEGMKIAISEGGLIKNVARGAVGGAGQIQEGLYSWLPHPNWTQNFNDRAEIAAQQGAGWWGQVRAGFGWDQASIAARGMEITSAYGAPARALGGPVSAGMPYIVGERRPELFVPSTSGRIVPSVPAGGGYGAGGVTINVPLSYHGPGGRAEGEELARVLISTGQRELSAHWERLNKEG